MKELAHKESYDNPAYGLGTVLYFLSDSNYLVKLQIYPSSDFFMLDAPSLAIEGVLGEFRILAAMFDEEEEPNIYWIQASGTKIFISEEAFQFLDQQDESMDYCSPYLN